MANSPEIIKPTVGVDTAIAAAAAHAPSVAGSVIEAKDGMGGSNFIRIQNMSATGMLFWFSCRFVQCA